MKEIISQLFVSDASVTNWDTSAQNSALCVPAIACHHVASQRTVVVSPGASWAPASPSGDTTTVVVESDEHTRYEHTYTNEE